MSRISLFLENARMLTEKFGIVPLLYGSLGLEYLTGESFFSKDIDILVPRIFVRGRWQEFKSVMEECGYVLTDEREHTLMRDGTEYSYADIEDLEPFADICVEDIGVQEVNGIRFLLLSLEQYLCVYKKSSKDGYRINIRQKKDADKIRFIEDKLLKK